MVPGRGGWGVFWQAERRRVKDKDKDKVKDKDKDKAEVKGGMFFMVVD